MPKKLDLDEVKRRLKSRHDINPDELEVLFRRDEEAVFAFYRKTVMKMKKVNTLVEAADGEGKIAVDDFKLPPEKRALIKGAMKEKKEVAEKKKETFQQGAADLSHLPEEQRVTYEETQKALEELSDLNLEDLD